MDDRRRFLGHAAGLGLLLPLGLGTASRAAGAARLPVSPRMDLGPFYPVERPLDDDADLTRLTGHSGRARGQVVEVSGRVLTPDGKPVPNAVIEIWQANANGRYAHHGDDHGLPLDDNFQGYATQKTDGDGAFRFLTVKPGAYPAGKFMRSPHIHFDVRGKFDRTVTQMYFPHEKWLKQDVVLHHDIAGQLPSYIFGRLAPGKSTLEPGATLCRFDVVLANG
jgi:protocatechuate 3,4-dioxygenase beta subunit